MTHMGDLKIKFAFVVHISQLVTAELIENAGQHIY